jgi:hypothetical protein
MFRTNLRRIVPLVLALTACLALARGQEKKSDEGFTPLFNGRDFTGIKFFVKGDSAPLTNWSVKDGAIICTGKTSGYMYTDKGYKNYVLRYDWRYPEGSKPSSNSGCLVHIQEPHKVWPQSVEPQGRYQDHGKLFFIGVKAIEQKFDADALKKALRPMGEWSTTEITCKPDGSITVKVNDIPVSSGKTELTQGPIGWQSEGAEIHFRNIKIKEEK